MSHNNTASPSFLCISFFQKIKETFTSAIISWWNIQFTKEYFAKRRKQFQPLNYRDMPLISLAIQHKTPKSMGLLDFKFLLWGSPQRNLPYTKSSHWSIHLRIAILHWLAGAVQCFRHKYFPVIPGHTWDWNMGPSAFKVWALPLSYNPFQVKLPSGWSWNACKTTAWLGMFMWNSCRPGKCGTSAEIHLVNNSKHIMVCFFPEALR